MIIPSVTKFAAARGVGAIIVVEILRAVTHSKLERLCITLTASKMECVEAGYGMTIASRSIPKLHPLQQGQRLAAATTFGNGLIGRHELLGRESSCMFAIAMEINLQVDKP